MKKAFILHGMPSKKEYYNPEVESPSNSHWIPWLQHQLNIKDVLTQAIELPHPYNPNYERWKEIFDQFDIDKESILIGHSCGAGFLVRWLSENKKEIKKLILVAPWLDPQGELNSNFFDFEIDKELGSWVGGIHIFISEDDYDFIMESSDIITNRISEAKVKKFTNKGHFTLDDMNTRKFPELLKISLE
ncbi:MAG: alpha/beta hydrolase [Candidatus Paceibacterota bacterium]